MSGISLKGSKDGIRVVLGTGDELEPLLGELAERLGKAERFLGETGLTVEVGSRPITAELTCGVLEVVARFPSLSVRGITSGEEPLLEDGPLPVNRLSRSFADPGPVPVGVPVPSWAAGSRTVVTQTLRSGKSVSCDGDLFVLGNVNPGAEVRAAGNIIVLGSLRGTAHASLGGGPGLIYANHLAPLQLRIGELVAARPETDREKWSGGRGDWEPEVAVPDGRHILIVPWGDFLEDDRLGQFFVRR